MKVITRRYYENNSIFCKSKIGKFIATGQWSNGYIAYSRVDDEGNIIEEGVYYQYRGSLHIKNEDGTTTHFKGLVMHHI